MKEFLTIEEFCRRYAVSRSTVYRLFDKGALEPLHVGRSVRIRASQAEAWADSLSGQAA